MAIDNARHIQRQELIDVLKMILMEDKAIAEGKISNYDDTALTTKVNAIKDKVDTITEISESEINEIFSNAYNKVFGN